MDSGRLFPTPASEGGKRLGVTAGDSPSIGPIGIGPSRRRVAAQAFSQSLQPVRLGSSAARLGSAGSQSQAVEGAVQLRACRLGPRRFLLLFAPRWLFVYPGLVAFFLGAMSSTSSDPSFGMDTMPPTSGQSWEYTGVWAPSRDLWVREAMFNAMISATGISEWIEPAPAPAPTRIDVNPNPFGTSARLNLINGRGTETTVEVFDATGSVVRTLDVVRGTTVFDGRDQAGRLLADGIYFARVRNNDSSVAKVVISR